MQLTKKQKFWLIQFGKFALFTAIWFWAWLVPLQLQLEKEAGGFTPPSVGFGVLAYFILLPILIAADIVLIKKYKNQYLGLFLLLAIEVVFLCQPWLPTILIVKLSHLILV